jgi:hypothetical protein
MEKTYKILFEKIRKAKINSLLKSYKNIINKEEERIDIV